MSTTDQTARLELSRARGLAARIVSELAPACDRIEIAGSIRRGRAEVGDIEIVAIPAYQHALFGQPGDSLLDARLDDLMTQGRIEAIKGGDKQKQFMLTKTGIKLDLFIVRPETWGVQLAIRTGPWRFSRALVTQRWFGGRLVDGLVVDDGRVWDGWEEDEFANVVTRGRALNLPEEADFLALAGGWIDPSDRRVDQPIHDPEEIQT